ncbi:hypothetical protein HK102_008915, partial [Quaeritorhiza haematococci]
MPSDLAELQQLYAKLQSDWASLRSSIPDDIYGSLAGPAPSGVPGMAGPSPTPVGPASHPQPSQYAGAAP